MNATNVKEKVLNAVQQFPQEITFEEAIDRLYFLYKIEQGIQQADSGKTIPHEEVKRQFKKWLE